jgi:pyruvate dehydrogenase E1 component beta subunit
MSQVFSYLQAIRDAQAEEMERDPTVVLLGEDVRRNIYGSTGELFDKFGGDRVFDTPMSENGYLGCGVGAAMTGLRPIVDIGISSFLYCAADQIISQAAKNRYLFGGQAKVPLTIRAGVFYNRGNSAQHADRPHAFFMAIPGLKIITPASPADAKGLLKCAIREDDPVLCFEDATCWSQKEEIPDGEHLVPLGVGRIRRHGNDVTIVAIAGSVIHAVAASEELAKEGVSAEVIDPRTLVPLDRDLILGSAARTGRLVLVDTANRTCSAASEIAAIAVEEIFESLKAPIQRVTTPDVHVPFSRSMERPLYPNAERIAAAVRRALAWRTGRSREAALG